MMLWVIVAAMAQGLGLGFFSSDARFCFYFLFLRNARFRLGSKFMFFTKSVRN
jgi:hypothetical protein